MDQKTIKRSKEIIEQMSRNLISYLIRLHSDEVNTEFPDNLPPSLLYSIPKRVANHKKVQNREIALKEEASEFLGCASVDQTRRSRFSGSYSLEEMASSSNYIKKEKMVPKVVAVEKTSQSGDKLVPSLRIKRARLLPGIESLDSRSRDMNETIQQEHQIHQTQVEQVIKRSPQTPKKIIETKKRKRLSSSSTDYEFPVASPTSSEEEEEVVKPLIHNRKASKKNTSNPSTSTSKVISKPMVTIPARNNLVAVEKKSVRMLPKIPLKSKSNLIEKPALKKPVFTVPPIVEPPKMNPKTSKIIRTRAPIVEKKNSFESLGGIFAIHNGWEDTAEETKLKEIALKKRPRSPIKVPQSEKLPEIHNGFKEISQVVDTVKQKSKFDRHFDTESESEEENEIIHENHGKDTLSDSDEASDDEEIKESNDAKADENVEKFTPKRQKLEVAEESHEPSKDILSDNDDDRISLCADDDDRIFLCADDDLEDGDEEYFPPGTRKIPQARKDLQQKEPEVEKNYTAELDELKMKVRIEPPTLSDSEVRKVLNSNTQSINMNGIPKLSQPPQRVLVLFGNVCIDFLENNCKEVGCKNSHSLPKVEEMREKFERCALKPVDDAFGAALLYPKVLDQFFSVFAEMFVKKSPNELSRLSRMIMECERNARSHQNYRIIVDALIKFGSKSKFEAVKFIVTHHTDSKYSRDILMSLIAETGPDIVRFVTYLQNVANQQTISAASFDKILKTVVSYQSPDILTFCLNNLLTHNPEYIRQLKKENVKQFLDIQTYLTQFNQEREEKLLSVLPKI